jgi:intracellular sulfur oxidation DsrE/DsrF family protein
VHWSNGGVHLATKRVPAGLAGQLSLVDIYTSSSSSSLSSSSTASSSAVPSSRIEFDDEVVILPSSNDTIQQQQQQQEQQQQQQQFVQSTNFFVLVCRRAVASKWLVFGKRIIDFVSVVNVGVDINAISVARSN